MIAPEVERATDRHQQPDGADEDRGGQPDDAPERLAGLTKIEACHSVAGDDAYVLLVRVASPTALEQLIREIRKRANVSTRTTVVLQTFFERQAQPPVEAPLTGKDTV